jgi:pimeloyl-ACP methyl ester carboxylesterase
MHVEYLYPIPGGESLQVSFFKKNEAPGKNTILFIHGFKGFKDWGFFPYSANYFMDKGFNAITFNFSHNGIEENPLEFTRLDKFAANTVSREVYEAAALIDGIRSGFFGQELKNTKIGVIGHSLGGAVSIALTNLRMKEISAIALWASIAESNRYTERQKEIWRSEGYFEFLNTRTNQVMRLNVEFLNDLEDNSEGLLNLKLAVHNMICPLFIAHGGQDLTVPVEDGKKLYEWSNKERTELFILPTSGHTFDVQHPFEGTNDTLERLLENSAKFFINNLGV